MKRRRIALLATTAVVTPVLLGGASALADTRAVPTPSQRATKPVSAAPSDESRKAGAGSVVTRLKEVPAEFEAGGEWKEFDLVLENITEKDVSGFILDIQVITIFPEEALHPPHMAAQVMIGGSWVDVELWDMGVQDVDVIVPVTGMVLPPGKTVIPVRMKFAGDAPSVEFYLGPRVDTDHAADDEEYWESSRIVRPVDPEPEPSPDPSEEPGPEPSEDPDPEPSPDPSG
ncbi:hypothetical protein YW5DRAFT_06836, partial [Streptomyces sp. Ncost-T6T-1]|uniref:hypothetical protein n=1 Tax=Streptomyces sp. Ncost-T6T-1 TaxID=1100828 RepID=UPI000805C367